MLKIAGSTVLIAVFLLAGCASSGATRSPDREYAIELDAMMTELERALAIMSFEIEDTARPDDDTYSLLVRQMNSAARGGATNSDPSLQTLTIRVQRLSPSLTGVSIRVPHGGYAATGGVQLRRDVLRNLDRRFGQD